LVRSWRHFATVIEISLLLDGKSWTETSISPLRSWIGVSRLVSKSFDIAHYHSAILIAYAESVNSGQPARGIIYTPHGISAKLLARNL